MYYWKITYEISDYDIMCSYEEETEICADSAHEAVEKLKRKLLNDHIGLKIISIKKISSDSYGAWL